MHLVIVWVLCHFDKELVLLSALNPLFRSFRLYHDFASLLRLQSHSHLILFYQSINHRSMVLCEVHEHVSTVFFGPFDNLVFHRNLRLPIRGY